MSLRDGIDAFCNVMEWMDVFAHVITYLTTLILTCVLSFLEAMIFKVHRKDVEMEKSVLYNLCCCCFCALRFFRILWTRQCGAGFCYPAQRSATATATALWQAVADSRNTQKMCGWPPHHPPPPRIIKKLRWSVRRRPIDRYELLYLLPYDKYDTEKEKSCK